jgi:hypothetical protein
LRDPGPPAVILSTTSGHQAEIPNLIFMDLAG